MKKVSYTPNQLLLLLHMYLAKIIQQGFLIDAVLVMGQELAER